jgi:hypothetical protein
LLAYLLAMVFYAFGWASPIAIFARGRTLLIGRAITSERLSPAVRPDARMRPHLRLVNSKTPVLSANAVYRDDA